MAQFKINDIPRTAQNPLWPISRSSTDFRLVERPTFGSLLEAERFVVYGSILFTNIFDVAFLES
jgi:hypothetical protein